MSHSKRNINVWVEASTSKFDYAVQPKKRQHSRWQRLVKFLTTPGECGESPIESLLAGIFMVLTAVMICLFAALISVG